MDAWNKQVCIECQAYREQAHSYRLPIAQLFVSVPIITPCDILPR